MVRRTPRPGHLGGRVRRDPEGSHGSQVALLGVARQLEAGAVKRAGQLLLGEVAHFVQVGHSDRRGFRCVPKLPPVLLEEVRVTSSQAHHHVRGVGSKVHPEESGRLHERHPGLGAPEAAQLPVLEEAVGVGLGPQEPHLQVRQAGPRQGHREGFPAHRLKGHAHRCQRSGVEVVHLVDQEQRPAVGTGCGLADLTEQFDQVLLGVPRIGHAGDGIDVELQLHPSGGDHAEGLHHPERPLERMSASRKGMLRPRKSPFALGLTAEQRSVLEPRARQYTLPYRDVVRPKVVVMAAAGMGNDEIAARLDTRREVVSKWRKRFFEQGLGGLEERPRRGRPPVFSPEVVVAVKALACELPSRLEVPLSRLYVPDIASEAVSRGIVAKISGKTVWRWLSEDAIKPWRRRSWIFARDPDFEAKAGRVLDLYAREWKGKALTDDDYVVSSNEETSTRARARRHPGLAPAPGRDMRVES